MPYKSEKIKIAGTKYDRRRKLTEEQKQEIVKLYESGTMSYQSIADLYGVSKRKVYFIVNPDKELKNKERLKVFKATHKPTKEEWAATVREHRRYKQKLYKEGEIS